jgi:hypothetical protein
MHQMMHGSLSKRADLQPECLPAPGCLAQLALVSLRLAALPCRALPPLQAPPSDEEDEASQAAPEDMTAEQRLQVGYHAHTLLMCCHCCWAAQPV